MDLNGFYCLPTQLLQQSNFKCRHQWEWSQQPSLQSFTFSHALHHVDSSHCTCMSRNPCITLSHTCTAVTLSRHTSPLSWLNLFGSPLVTHICHSSVSSSYNILVLAYLRRDNLCFPSCSPAVPKRVAHFRSQSACAEAPTFSLLPWLVFFVALGSERGSPSLAICPCSSPLVWC